MSDFLDALGRILRDTLRAGLRTASRPARRATKTATGTTAPKTSDAYPGDYRGMPTVTYAPQPGKRPDPGEIVWTWVPYEEDHTRGKDRPVVLVGRDGDWLLGLQLTSLDHDLDAAQEAREGRYWVDIGSGAWDAQRRPSEVRVNRVLRIDPDAVRRVSVTLPKPAYDKVVAGMRRHLR